MIPGDILSCSVFYGKSFWAIIFLINMKLGERLDSCPAIHRITSQFVNTLMPRQNGRYFAADIILDENCRILIQISLKCVPN